MLEITSFGPPSVPVYRLTWFLGCLCSGNLRFFTFIFCLRQKALAQANDAKLEGNKLYGNGQFEEALSQYELALYLAPDMPSSVEIRSTCHSNRAICYLKLVCFVTFFEIYFFAISQYS